MRYLAVDPGGKRMGLALGDDVTGVASPLKVVAYHSASSAAAVLHELMTSHRTDAVVVGLPLNEEGERTPACARSEALGRALGEFGVEVIFQGEYLTTNEARRRARESGLPKGRPVDHIAAQVLLEEFLIGRSA